MRRSRVYAEPLISPLGLEPAQLVVDQEPCGERRLAFFVVQDALEIAVGRRIARREIREATEAWVESESRAVKSFLWWCELIGIEPEFLRRLVRENKIRTVSRAARRVAGLKSSLMDWR